MPRYCKYALNYVYRFLNCYYDAIVNVYVGTCSCIDSLLCTETCDLVCYNMRNLEEDTIDIDIGDSECDTDSE